jgi:hypothetical protein
MTRAEKQQKFINTNRLQIVNECFKNKDKTGYVRLFADLEFNPAGDAEFVEGKFNKNDFHLLDGMLEPSNPEKVNDAFYIYYSVHWFDNKTTWNVKELVLASEL